MASEATTVAPTEEIVKVQRPDGEALLTTSNTMLASAQALVIDSDEMYEVAAEELGSVKRKLTELQEREKSLVTPLLTVVDGIRELFRRPKQLLEDGEKAIKGAMTKYVNDKEAAAKKARDEAEAQARQKRQEAEEEARKEQQRAQELEAAGQADEAIQAAQRAAAARLVSEVASAPAVSVVAAPKVAGISTRKTWKCALPESQDDKLKALRFIVENPQYLNLVEFSQKTANQLATAQRSGFNVPGLRAYEDTVIAGSRK